MALIASLSAAQDGQKLTEQFIKSSGETVKAIAETKLQIQKTVDAYNGLRSDEVKNRRGAYKSLLKEMDNCEKRLAGVQKRVAAMDPAATEYFEHRASSLEAISSDDLRSRGEARLAESRSGYADALAAGGKAGDDYRAFMGRLKDQVAFLGHDLNPSAVASLEQDAKELNGAAKSLYGEIDGTIADLNEYIRSLRPE